MSTERDDEENDLDERDRRMRRLLERWGRDVSRTRRVIARGGAILSSRLFDRPADLPRLRAGLDSVDDELARRATLVTPRRGGVRWVPRILAAAILIAVVVVAWEWTDRTSRTGRPATGSSSPEISGVGLSTLESVVRGEPRLEFRSGDGLFLHFRSDRRAVAQVALLDARGGLGALLSEPEPIEPGPSRIGRFVLDDEAGTETFILIAAESGLGASDFAELLAAAFAAVPGESRAHADRLAPILSVIRSRPGVSAEAITIRHVP